MSRKVDVDDYEADLHVRLQGDLKARELDIESTRLLRVQQNAERLRARIKVQLDRLGSTSGSGQVRRLQERLEEMLTEEENIKQRITEITSQNDQIDVKQREVISNDHDLSTVDSKDEVDVDEDNTAYEKEEYTVSVDSDEESDSDASEGFVDDYEESDYYDRIKKLPAIDTIECVHLYNNFKVPKMVFDRLFDYQKDGLMWLLKLYAQRAGGILGDEMGLGKTLQVIAAVSALHMTGLLTAPVLIVCPTTLIKQWLTETQTWWPYSRVIVIHGELSLKGSRRSAKDSLKRAFEGCHLVITSYGHLQQHADLLVDLVKWRGVFLDEGHKIRNPQTAISLLCKRLKTTHRYILSGTPIQNNLIELWSLFDFCFPGKLGSLSVFKEEFAMPINAGGYVNASSLQVQRAYSSACALRDLIEPYLLRRLKVDVAKQLPPKREQIVFCPLTDYQKQLYLAFLDSEEVHSILLGKRNVLYGIDILRKIANHPDMLEEAAWNADILDHKRLDPTLKSGKLSQLMTILSEWHRQGRKVLLFCQTRQMLDLVESFVKLQFHGEFASLRMDGMTSVQQRSILVDRFNADPRVFVFFLTTRVGGLGVNLTGADRVVIVDPDWNPSTDQQARERSWRLGQDKPVLIYRLIAEGTVEEKILHRQVFKTFLTQRVLKDPKQSRFFKHADLHDLFTFGCVEQGEEEKGDDKSDAETNDNPIMEKRLITDLVDVAGIRHALEASREVLDSEANMSRTKRIVADSVASLQHSGQSVRQTMGIADMVVDPEDLLRAVQNLASQADPTVVSLAKKLRDFLKQPGGVTSATIFTAFPPDTHHEAVLLKQTLKALAVLDKSTHKWTLKPAFQK